VTPLGRPLALNVTLALNPVAALTIRFTAAVAPSATLTDDAPALKVKAGGAVTVTTSAVVALMPPPAAVMVTVWLTRLAAVVAEKANTLEPEPGAAKLAGEKLAETPLGRPVALSVTGALNPFAPATLKFTAAFAPCARLTDGADALIAIVGGGTTVTANGSVLVSAPLFAVTTSV
jgi:hypothetical protein